MEFYFTNIEKFLGFKERNKQRNKKRFNHQTKQSKTKSIIFYVNEIKIPTQKNSIIEIREFIEKHQLNVKTVGKGRKKQLIVKDINNIMNLNQKLIPMQK